MQLISKLADAFEGSTNVYSQDLSPSECKVLRLIFGAFSGVFAVGSVYGAYRFGTHVTNLENIMRAQTTSDSPITNLFVDGINVNLAAINLYMDAATTAVSGAAAFTMNELRERFHDPDDLMVDEVE
jgi:hypothetical protein